jgi:hypothetical protein
MTGTSMVHVPYRGETLVYNDMLGERVDVFFGNISGAFALYLDGKLKVLAVTDKARAAAMPDVPTSAEVGLPGLLSGVWYAMVGPPKLKPELQDQIAKATIEVLKMPDVQQRFRTLNVEPDGSTPAETAAFIKNEVRRWGEVIRANNIMAEWAIANIPHACWLESLTEWNMAQMSQVWEYWRKTISSWSAKNREGNRKSNTSGDASAPFPTLDQTVSALKGDVPGGSLERLGVPSRYLTVVLMRRWASRAIRYVNGTRLVGLRRSLVRSWQASGRIDCMASDREERMIVQRRRFLHLAAGAAALPAISRIADAQGYPSRTVRMVVGLPLVGVPSKRWNTDGAVIFTNAATLSKFNRMGFRDVDGLAEGEEL